MELLGHILASGSHECLGEGDTTHPEPIFPEVLILTKAINHFDSAIKVQDPLVHGQVLDDVLLPEGRHLIVLEHVGQFLDLLRALDPK